MTATLFFVRKFIEKVGVKCVLKLFLTKEDLIMKYNNNKSKNKQKI